VMLFNVEAGKSSALTTGVFENLEPAWSSDGKRLAYVSTDPNGWFNILVAEINNGQKGTVTPIS